MKVGECEFTNLVSQTGQLCLEALDLFRAVLDLPRGDDHAWAAPRQLLYLSNATFHPQWIFASPLFS